MEVNYSVTGKERKELVTKIGEVTGVAPKYLGMPTMAYQIGNLTVDRHGVLISAESDNEFVKTLVWRLEKEGFKASEPEEPEEAPADDTETAAETQEPEQTVSEKKEEVSEDKSVDAISVPDNLSDDELDNLIRLVRSKETLLKHAFKTDKLDIISQDGKILFPWFQVNDGDHATAYMIFIEHLVKMAKDAKRITGKDHEVGNERYALRCFLLRLGLIGSDAKLKTSRKILLENLSGSSAFKDGAKREEAEA